MTITNERLVKIIDCSPLYLAIMAIRKCWKSEEKSDSRFIVSDGPWATRERGIDEFPGLDTPFTFQAGEKDLDLIRGTIKHGHESTLEHIKYTFDVNGISRRLQELARHRIASLSVQSTRYVLKRLINIAPDDFLKLIVMTEDAELNAMNVAQLQALAGIIKQRGLKNDLSKFGIPEALKTSLIWTINVRSLRNFMHLRTSSRALWEIRNFAKAALAEIPRSHLIMFEDFLYGEAA